MPSQPDFKHHSHNIWLYSIRQWLHGAHALYSKVEKGLVPKAGELILDVGCGTGKLLRYFADTYPDISLVGIDPSGEALERARILAGSRAIKFKVAYASKLPFMDESFDWVISTLVFHHIAPEDKKASVYEMIRVLKPGGTALIVDLGRPQNIVGILMWLFSRTHAYTKGNMEAVEESLKEISGILYTIEYQLGFIEHITIHKHG